MTIPAFRTSSTSGAMVCGIGFALSCASSEAAGPVLEVSRLGQSRAAFANPGGDPIYHLADADLWFAKKRKGFFGVAEQSVVRFHAFERHGLAHSGREFLGHFPDGQDFGPGNVQNGRRSRGVVERSKAHRRSIALPDRV